jgi:hypothetical protein
LAAAARRLKATLPPTPPTLGKRHCIDQDQFVMKMKTFIACLLVVTLASLGAHGKKTAVNRKLTMKAHKIECCTFFFACWWSRWFEAVGYGEQP